MASGSQPASVAWFVTASILGTMSIPVAAQSPEAVSDFVRAATAQAMQQAQAQAHAQTQSQSQSPVQNQVPSQGGQENYFPAQSVQSYNGSANPQAPATSPTILPPDPSAPGGGNPFQGLGRIDDTAPSRRSQFEAPNNSNPESEGQPANMAAEDSNISESAALPPPIQSQGASAAAQFPPTAIQENATDALLKKAIGDLEVGRYGECLTAVDQAIALNGKLAAAHYLKAVAYVLIRRFNEARAEYTLTIAYSTSADLTRKARLGLAKLSR